MMKARVRMKTNSASFFLYGKNMNQLWNMLSFGLSLPVDSSIELMNIDVRSVEIVFFLLSYTTGSTEYPTTLQIVESNKSLSLVCKYHEQFTMYQEWIYECKL